MKKLMYICNFFLTGLVCLLVSCQESSDLLDPETSGISKEDVFTDSRNAMLFLNSIYGNIVPVVPTAGGSGMRWPSQDAMLDVTTDNGASILTSIYSCHFFNNGSWTPSSTTFSSVEWTNNYASIRACNLFLAEIDNVPLSSEYQFDAITRSYRKGEAIFLKAFFYSEMMKQFGGLPIIDRVVSITDEMDNPRATFDETVSYIAGLCDNAAALLPDEHPDIDYGRATKGAALALKARVLLYAASPLWNNPAKPGDSPFRGKYDESKWEKAARAAGAVIAMSRYSLYDNLKDLFTTRTNPELIFVRMNRYANYMTVISIPAKLSPSGRSNRSGCNQVTYNMVKEYEVLKNGDAYSIDDPNSGYDPNNPFINRDPRFYRDCMFNGYQYQGKTAVFGELEQGVTKDTHNPSDPSAFYTYVFSIKFADLMLNLDNPSSTNQNYPYLRYAEVLLNYAEAMNEAFGPETDGLGNGKTALWAVNQVRTRAQYVNSPEYLGLTGGMPPIENGLSKPAMREKIRHERRVELSFEEHRFWDMRRWMIEPVTVSDIQAQIPVWKLDGTLEYQIRTIQNRVYDRKMFRMPIPQNQLYSNRNLVQNPGYNMSPEAAD